MKERIEFVVLLLSEGFILSSGLLHQYHFVDQNLTWTEAQTYCRQTYTDLATIENEEDMEKLKDTVSSAGYSSDIWIGLHTEINWRWSDGFTGSGADYRNWGTEPFDSAEELCVVYKHGDKWFDTFCITTYPFICYYGTQLDPEFVLVNERKNWSDAQKYCRENYTDLATVRNQEEDQRVQNLVPSGNFAWIGLIRAHHICWSDGSSFTNTDYDPPPAGSLTCGFTSAATPGRWKFSSCENKSRFVCYSIPSIKQQVVKLRLKMWDSVNKPALKADLLKKLQDRLKENGVTGVTLKWREQPDGEVFHKEGKSKKTEL